MIAKIKNLAPGEDSAEWVRFWDTYQGAIRQFAAFKGGEEHADDVVMQVLARLVDVLREGRYSPEKGKFHSYLATMIVNEVRMMHRSETVRGGDRTVPIDTPIGGDRSKTVAEMIAAPAPAADALDDDWRRAVLASAREHVLMHTAISDRDRQIYRAYAVEGGSIDAVARKFGVSRNNVSKIKSRIEKRIVAAGQRMIANAAM
ncbi:MAG: sigma-70 family RNA polymerase sigma factor [Kiritimatiellae bacterium]|nr:sigma-70 family RNA polymerase sigma factor [Kiritimatiellia bacterium]